jgi:hypothetical protein
MSELLASILALTFLYFLFCLFMAAGAMSDENRKPVGEQDVRTVFSKVPAQMLSYPRRVIGYPRRLFLRLSKTMEQRIGLLLFAVSFVVLFLFAMMHSRLDCYSCDLEDFLPRHSTPFLYDVFFWLAVAGLITAIFGGRLRHLKAWIKQGA